MEKQMKHADFVVLLKDIAPAAFGAEGDEEEKNSFYEP